MKEEFRPLEVNSFSDLADKDLGEDEPLIDNFLPGKGVFLFCGSAKSGKSYMVLDIGMHVCTGEKFWNYDVRKKDVLYLYLEDGEPLLQKRMFEVSDKTPDNYFYAITAARNEENLLRQLELEMQMHPDIGLIIIDTLTAIRQNNTSSLGNTNQIDYNFMNGFHELTKKYRITILIVHHLRKMQSDDPFNDISGTHGLYSSADGAYVLRKSKFSDESAKLYIKNRDMDPRVLTVQFDKISHRWDLLEESNPVEDPLKTDPDLRKTLEIIRQKGGFHGPAAELCELIGSKKKPQSLSVKLFSRRRQLEKMGIYIEKYRRNIGVFFHISLMTDIPDELVMTPPPAIEFPLETEESIAELIEEQEKADENFPVEPAPEEKKPVADPASEEAKSEESEEVKTFSLFREIDFYISCARGA